MKERLIAAIQEAEKTTAGEIMVYVAKRSDAYPEARWRLAIVFSLLVAFAVTMLFPGHDAIWLLWVQLPALLVGFAVGSIPFLQRLAISEDSMIEEVHQRALQAFHAMGLNATKDRTGTLIFVSLFERRMEVLGDSGISAKLHQETWNELVKESLDQIRSRDLETGVETAIRRCGAILTQHFPGSHLNPNELVNHVVIEA